MQCCLCSALKFTNLFTLFVIKASVRISNKHKHYINKIKSFYAVVCLLPSPPARPSVHAKVCSYSNVGIRRVMSSIYHSARSLSFHLSVCPFNFPFIVSDHSFSIYQFLGLPGSFHPPLFISVLLFVGFTSSHLSIRPMIHPLNHSKILKLSNYCAYISKSGLLSHGKYTRFCLNYCNYLMFFRFFFLLHFSIYFLLLLLFIGFVFILFKLNKTTTLKV